MIQTTIIVILAALVIVLARMWWEERKFMLFYRDMAKVTQDLSTNQTARFIELSHEINRMLTTNRQNAEGYIDIIAKQEDTIAKLNAERVVHDGAFQDYIKKQMANRQGGRSPFLNDKQ